jgi:hypothetical protein
MPLVWVAMKRHATGKKRVYFVFREKLFRVDLL